MCIRARFGLGGGGACVFAYGCGWWRRSCVFALGMGVALVVDVRAPKFFNHM